MPPTCYVGYRPLRFLRSWGQGCHQTRQALGVRWDGHMQDETADGIRPRHGESRGRPR